MGKLSKFIQDLFNRQDSEKSKIPFLHEAIDVKSYPISSLLEWHTSGKWDEFLELIQSAYRDKLITGKNSNGKVSTMQTQYANGFIIHCRNQEHLDIDYKHLAYYLQDKIKKEGYILNLSEIRSQERGSKIETIVKYYLKPSVKVRFDNPEKGSKANQLYGNITIQFTAIDSIPNEFKLIAKAYQDSKFHQPLDFDLLLDAMS